MECVDIITTDGVGITVWAKELPPDKGDLLNDGPIPFLDLVYPSDIPTVSHAIAFARTKLGNFCVDSVG